MAIMVVCMLVSLGLTVFSVMILIADRVGSASRSETLLIDPQELRPRSPHEPSHHAPEERVIRQEREVLA